MEEEINRVAELIVGTTHFSGDKRKKLFEVHNKILSAGLSKRWILKKENAATLCGSCLRRVRQNFWKFYHFEFEGRKSSNIAFYGREGGGRISESQNDFSPIYVRI